MPIVQWIGTTGLWNQSFNWSGGSLPTAADDVELDVGANVTNISAAVVNELSLSGNALLVSDVSMTVATVVRIGFGGSGTSRLWVRGGTLTAPDIVVGFFNAGQLIVANGSTVAGSIEVGNGSVIIGGTVPDEAGTILGNIILNNGGASSLTFRTTNNASYGGNISGAGSILIDSAGQFTTLTGDNSGHSGTTTVQAGMLRVGAFDTTGTLGTGGVILMNGTFLLLNRSDTQLITNAISGAGTVVVSGVHTVILAGANAYGTTEIAEANTLQVGNGGTTGTLGTGAVLNEGTLAFQHAAGFYTHANAISGSGNLVVRGNAGEILTGNNSYSGTTTVESGVLAIGQGGTTGTLGTGAVTIASGAFLDLIRSDTQVIANTITGGGELRVYGNQTAILTANNSYGNSTIFAGSTLQIGNGGSTGTLGTGAVTNDGTLVFNHGFGGLLWGAAIGGSGNLVVNGFGVEFLGGVNSYTGATTINSGALALDGAGSIANSSTVTINGTGIFDIRDISGPSASVRDVFLTGSGTQILLGGKTLIVTHADLYAGPGSFQGSGLVEAVIFNVASANFTLAGAGTGAVFSNWTDGQDSITIIGNAGANTLTGDEVQATNIDGGAGNDRIVISNGAGNYNGGADSDTLVVGSNMTLTGGLVGLEGIELQNAANLTLTSAQVAGGLAINSVITGSASNNLTINMTAGVSLVTKVFNFSGFGGVVLVNGTSGTDVIKLGDALNIVSTQGGASTVQGGNLADNVIGGVDIDKIAGNGGADVLSGGGGADVFKFRKVTDSGLGASADIITDFLSGTDRLNFSRIDTNLGLAGDQGFAYVGTGAFTGGGTASIRYVDTGNDIRVEADANGDGVADMHVILQSAGLGAGTLTAADFVL